MRWLSLLKGLGALSCAALASLAAAAVLLGWAAGERVQAATGELEPFFGTYVGSADVTDLVTGETGQRDLDIVIEPHDQSGFSLHWVSVARVDGRRDVPGVQRRVQTVLFAPSDQGDFFVEVQKESPFRERGETQPMRGDPVRWAYIEDDTLHVASFVVLEDGRYELQLYERMLTETGLDIEFQRLQDGELLTRIVGSTARADAGSSGE